MPADDHTKRYIILCKSHSHDKCRIKTDLLYHKREKQISKNNEESIVSSPIKMINSDGLPDDREQNGGSSLLKHNKNKTHLNFIIVQVVVVANK